jgi:hypothetical protein
MGYKRNVFKVFVRKVEEYNYVEELGVGRTLLKWIIKDYDGRIWNVYI